MPDDVYKSHLDARKFKAILSRSVWLLKLFHFVLIAKIFKFLFMGNLQG